MKNPNILYAFFDMKTAPPTMEIIRFLVLAELERKKIGLKGLGVIFVLDAPDHLQHQTNCYNYNNITYPVDFTQDFVRWRTRNVHIRCCWLFPSVKEIQVFTSRTQARAFENIFVKHAFPPNYKVDRPTDSSREKDVQEASINYVLPSFQTTPQSRQFVQNWININIPDKKIISLTIKEHSNPAKNNDINSWTEFAKRLDHSKYHPVFVRDTDAALTTPIPPQLEKFTIFHEAAWNIELLTALYELSYLNLITSSGVYLFASHNQKTKALIVAIPPTHHSVFREQIVEPGMQYSYFTPFHKLIWDNDNLATLEFEFQEMCNKIDFFLKLTLNKWTDWIKYFISRDCIQGADWASSQVIEKHFDNPAAWLLRATTLRLTNQLADALEAIEKTIMLNNSPEAFAELSNIRQRLNQKEHFRKCDEIKWLSQASLDEIIIKIINNFEKSDFSSMERLSEWASRRYSDNYISWVVRAASLRLIYRVNEALEAIQKAIKIQETPEAIYELVRIYLSLRLEDEANQVIKEKNLPEPFPFNFFGPPVFPYAKSTSGKL